ncbi:MAG TPA: SAF domain-containing protein [Candidatus Elarobacter sp.]|nr:SAF domain-containing protein [Candidatus Elarobacter sp.]
MLVTVRIVTGDLGSLHRRAHELGPDISVVLAARDIPLGTTIAPADLRVVRRPSATVAADALRNTGGAVGHIVGVALVRDDVVSARHLVTDINGVVGAGERAVHVVVKDGFEPPVGAVVDVLATFDPSVAAGAHPAGEATIVARGARVMEPSAPAAPEPTTAATPSETGAGVMLLVTEAEARVVSYAAAIGEVSLAIAPVQVASRPVSP